jgi:phage gp29-like protein
MAKKIKIIKQGGNEGANDIILSQPEIFHFNMSNYMSAVTSASSIDFSRRTMLYNLYESSKLDLHLTSVLDKRLRAATRFPIEFWRNGEADDVITPQLKSPWFKEMRKELLLSQFWGYSLLQIYLDEEGWITFDSINRKHYDPVKRVLLKNQSDQEGISIDRFENMLFVGTDRGLGIFAELLPAVLYKRSNMADWAKFANIFGMPIREYTYDAGDEETRKQLIADARNQGTNAVYIHPKDSELHIVDSPFKASSSNIFEGFLEYWDKEISTRILGNTLTTQASDTGTQALGTVHKDEEEEINADDRTFILDILNYEMKDIFANLGFNVEGGEFVYAEESHPDLQQQLTIVQGLNSMGLPMDDDWLYQTFGIEKPKDYDKIKQEKEEAKKAMLQSLNEPTPPKPKEDDEKKGLRNKLMSFFGLATPTEADEW